MIEIIESLKEQGVNVFPIQPRSKVPLESWKKYQSEKYTGIIPEGYNYAVIGGTISDDLVVVDIDGKREDLLNLIIPDCLNTTLTVQTGSGGYHIYLKAKTKKSFTMETFDGVHFDIQSHGKYVVGAGSTHPNGNQYKVISDTTQIYQIDPYTLKIRLDKLGTATTQLTLGNKDFDKIGKGVGVKVGNRHNEAVSYANHLANRLGEDVTEETLEYELKNWNNSLDNPLPDSEVESIAKSCHAFVSQNPVQRTEVVDGKQRVKRKDDDIPLHEVADLIMDDHKFRTLKETKEILVYEDGKYAETAEAESLIMTLSEQIFKECTTHKTNEVVNIIKRRTLISLKEFDSDVDVINLRNGLFNIRTLEFSEHDHNYMSRIQLPVYYDSAAKCDKFLKFLNECLPNPASFYTALQAFASTLLKTAKFEKAFMNIGGGANGKSTFLEVLQCFLGEDNVSNVSIHELQENRFAKARLDGKLANIYADISSSDLKETDVLKMLITGENIDVEKKNLDPYRMKNTAKLFFSANKFPEVEDQSVGFFRRFLIIHWLQNFTGKTNTNLRRELVEDSEMSGLFNLISKVANKLNQGHTFLHDPEIEKLRKTWNENSIPIQKYINERISEHPDYYVELSSLYSDYEEFCIRNNMIKETAIKFNKTIDALTKGERDQRRIDGEPIRIWKGVTLKTRLRKFKTEGLS